MTPDRRSVTLLAGVLDDHWLERLDTGVGCTCGRWFFAFADDHALPELGDKFLPFSKHVAEMVVAALPPSDAGAIADLVAAAVAWRDDDIEGFAPGTELARRLADAVDAYRASKP